MLSKHACLPVPLLFHRARWLSGRGEVAPAVLPHHRANGSVHGGSV